MSEDGWDVNVEYEKLFGSAKRVNLFDSEEEYDELRQYIIAQPLETDITQELPFEGIVLPIIERKPRIDECKKTIISTILTNLQNRHKADRYCQSVIKPVAPDKPHLLL